MKKSANEVKRALLGVTLNTCDSLRKVIKEYSDGYSLVINLMAGVVELYKDDELVTSKMLSQVSKSTGLDMQGIIREGDVVLYDFGFYFADVPELKKEYFISK